MVRRFRWRWTADSGGGYKYCTLEFPRHLIPTLVAAVPAEKRQDAGPHTGRASFYEVGLGGVCGFATQPSDFVVALSPGVFDAFPGATPGDPSQNPICGHQAMVTYNKKSITVTIADRCVSCAFNDIDLSANAFQALAGGLDVGFVDVSWEIVGL